MASKSKYNFKCKNQVILLMVTDDKKQHYLAIKKLSALLTRITLKLVGHFYCLNCFHLSSTKNNFEKHEKVCNDHDYCYVEILNEDNKISKYNLREQLMKVPFIIYADLECFLEKIPSYQNDSEKSYTEKNISTHPLVIHCLHNVHLIQQKICLTVMEVKTVWKGFVRNSKIIQRK